MIYMHIHMLRSVLIKEISPHVDQKKHGLYRHAPPNWPDEVTFCDPNNGHGRLSLKKNRAMCAQLYQIAVEVRQILKIRQCVTNRHIHMLFV